MPRDTSAASMSSADPGRLAEAMSVAIGLWNAGLASSEAVVAWADLNILGLDAPPMELVELSLQGPETCARRAEADFPLRPKTFSFAQHFAIRAFGVSIEDKARVLSLAHWLSRACMGRDLADPDVALGYKLDHLLFDCSDPASAIATLQSALRDTSARREHTMQAILAAVPDLSIAPVC